MEQFPPPYPSCRPPGSRGDAVYAADPGSGESQGNTVMEVSRRMVNHSLYLLYLVCMRVKCVMYGCYSHGICKNVIKQRGSGAFMKMTCVFALVFVCIFIMSAEGWCHNYWDGLKLLVHLGTWWYWAKTHIPLLISPSKTLPHTGAYPECIPSTLRHVVIHHAVFAFKIFSIMCSLP